MGFEQSMRGVGDSPQSAKEKVHSIIHASLKLGRPDTAELVEIIHDCVIDKNGRTGGYFLQDLPLTRQMKVLFSEHSASFQ
jgi:hypothetical protein